MIGIHSTNKFVSDFLTVKDVNINRCTGYNRILILLYDSQNKNPIESMLCWTIYFITWTAVKIYKGYYTAFRTLM